MGRMIAMPDQHLDLPSIEQQIRIARLKLGTVLDRLESQQLEQVIRDQILDCAVHVNDEVDRLIEALRQHADRS
jgi:hypothetical protein